MIGTDYTVRESLVVKGDLHLPRLQNLNLQCEERDVAILSDLTLSHIPKDCKVKIEELFFFFFFFFFWVTGEMFIL